MLEFVGSSLHSDIHQLHNFPVRLHPRLLEQSVVLTKHMVNSNDEIHLHHIQISCFTIYISTWNIKLMFKMFRHKFRTNSLSMYCHNYMFTKFNFQLRNPQVTCLEKRDHLVQEKSIACCLWTYKLFHLPRLFLNKMGAFSRRCIQMNYLERKLLYF